MSGKNRKEERKIKEKDRGDQGTEFLPWHKRCAKNDAKNVPKDVPYPVPYVPLMKHTPGAKNSWGVSAVRKIKEN